MDKQERLKELEESLSKGIIDKEEYKKKKEEIIKQKVDQDIPDREKSGDKKEDFKEKAKKSSDKILIFLIFGLIIMFAIVLLSVRVSKEKPKTIEELHELNFKGKLDPNKGYIYKNKYSFVKIENDWYTQLISQSGTRLYDIGFRYSPKEVEDITITGSFNVDKFNDAKDYYVTYNPLGDYDPKGEGSFSYVILAINDFNQHMLRLYEKMPIAACDRNETDFCHERPIINCTNTDKIVLDIKEGEIGKVTLKDNCIIIYGKGLDLVKGIDRILYSFYDIMDS